ncbi:MAG: MoaD/ThiS family protein [Xanthomonadales bacterium]|nr:MoaD/ThiS family protein [Xanthomonadales bacterium]
MKLTIEYYAQLRDEAGCSKEIIETSCNNPAALFAELDTRHGFSLAAAQLRVAINDEFANWDSPLADNDRLVFMPPMAGG